MVIGRTITQRSAMRVEEDIHRQRAPCRARGRGRVGVGLGSGLEIELGIGVGVGVGYWPRCICEHGEGREDLGQLHVCIQMEC